MMFRRRVARLSVCCCLYQSGLCALKSPRMIGLGRLVAGVMSG